MQQKKKDPWGQIFKNEDWLNAVMNITYDEPISPPVPVLIGHDIFKLYEGSSDQVYLMLTTNDWGGDVQYAKEQIFDSLRPHSYDNESHEVHIKGTNITIALEKHIEELELEEPRKLFHIAVSYTHLDVYKRQALDL